MKQRLPFTFTFVAFALCLLLGPLRPYLVETAALTPFYTTESFAAETISKPCGLLFYLASFLQSCFARPWLGASLFVAVLVAIAYVQRWAFRMSNAWFGLCWLTPFALLLNYTQLGYLVYTLKFPAVAFTPALGFLFTFGFVGLWFRWDKWWWKVAFALVVPAIGFWLFGVYGILAALFTGFCELGIGRWGLMATHKGYGNFVQPGIGRFGRRLPFTDERDRHMLWGIVVFSLGSAVPVLLRKVLPYPIDVWAGLVQFTDAERQMRLPWILALMLPTFFAIFRMEGKRLWQTVVSAIVFVAAAFATYTYSFRDANFLGILHMKHAAEAGQWEQVLRLARTNEEEPTRAQVCLARLALFKTGRMGNELFAYPDGAATYNAPQQNQWLRLMIGSLLYYHYGKTGFAYRWAMEDLVEYGERPAYLRYLLKVARLNGEQALARRYEAALDRTLFYKSSEYSECSENSDYSDYSEYSEYSENSEYSDYSENSDPSLRPLLSYTDQLDGDNGLVEFYLLQSFALSQGGSRPMVELALMNSLITKNLTDFWPRFMALLPGWNGKIPTHYQEAALMVAQLQGGMDTSSLPIDPAIRQRFEQLVQASAQNGDNASNAYALRPAFGDTYWYYYFFVQGMKTT